MTACGKSRGDRPETGSGRQLRRDTEHRPRLGKPAVKRDQRRALLRGDRELEGVAGSKPKRMLIGKSRCRPKLSTRDADHHEALGDELVEQGEGIAAR